MGKQVTRSKTMSLVERAVYITIPLVAAIATVLISYVSADAKFGVTPKDYIVTSLTTAGFYMLFYFPARALFKDMFMNKVRIQAKVLEYSVRSTLVYNGHLKSFADYCEVEYERRKQRYIERNLQIVDIDYSAFVSKYKFDKNLVKEDEELSKKQKKALIKIIIFLPRIKKQDYESVLPGTEFGTEFKRIKSSEDRTSKFYTTKKVITSTALAFATVSLVFTVDTSVSPLAIAIQIIVRIAGGATQILFALWHANKMVNKSYFNELCEKNMFIDEFIEENKLNNELNGIMLSAKKSLEDAGGTMIVVKEVVIQEIIKTEEPAKIEEVNNVEHREAEKSS